MRWAKLFDQALKSRVPPGRQPLIDTAAARKIHGLSAVVVQHNEEPVRAPLFAVEALIDSTAALERALLFNRCLSPHFSGQPN